MWTSILIAVLVLLALAVVFGGLLGFAAERFRVEGNPLVDQIDSMLPKPSAASVVFPAAVPTPNPLPTAMPSTNALRAVKPPSRHWRTCWTWSHNRWTRNTGWNRPSALR